MKKLMLYAALAACLIIFPVGAQADTITIYDPPNDAIGHAFETYSITYTVDEDPIQITIATNYPEAGIKSGDWQTLPADLLLDGSANGTGWDYAIPLVNHHGFIAGQVYEIGSLYVSDDFEPLTGGPYGYKHNIPVMLKTGEPLGIGGNWAWNVVGTDPKYNIASLNTDWYWDTYVRNDDYEIVGRDFLRIGWATATCANDPVNIPEPGVLLLLGLGLVGVAAVRRKFKS